MERPTLGDVLFFPFLLTAWIALAIGGVVSGLYLLYAETKERIRGR